MKRGFTLVELMVVLGIMTMMGALTVAGYRQMKRGMEERSVMENVNKFIRTAYQRAQIDRQPVSIYFWNETLKKRSDENYEIVVGKAVAVRRSGRLSKVRGDYLYDEFGDLEFKDPKFYQTEEGSGSINSSDEALGVNLYKMSGNSKNAENSKSIINESSELDITTETLMLGGSAEIRQYAFKIKDSKGVSWKTGDAYGFEFDNLTLPEGYLFGKDYSQNASSPTAGHKMIKFKVSANAGDGAMSGEDGTSTVEVFSLRAGNSGSLSEESVGVSQSPTTSLDQS